MRSLVRKFVAFVCYRCASNPGGGCRDCGVRHD
jgi:hypothetical protein